MPSAGNACTNTGSERKFGSELDRSGACPKFCRVSPKFWTRPGPHPDPGMDQTFPHIFTHWSFLSTEPPNAIMKLKRTSLVLRLNLWLRSENTPFTQEWRCFKLCVRRCSRIFWISSKCFKPSKLLLRFFRNLYNAQSRRSTFHDGKTAVCSPTSAF